MPETKMTKEEFGTYLLESYDALIAKQGLLQKEYDLSSYEQYRYDQENDGNLEFLRDGRPGIVFKTVLLGSWSPHHDSWLWGWEHQGISETLQEKSLSLKGLYEKTGLRVFSESTIAADEGMAHELAGISVDYINAMGLFVIPTEKAKVFLALTSTVNH